MATTTAPSPNLKPGAYIERDGRLFEVIGPERDDAGVITGKMVLENCLTLHRSTDTLDMITAWYSLVKEAPAIGKVPEHLDRELTEHCVAAGLTRSKEF